MAPEEPVTAERQRPGRALRAALAACGVLTVALVVALTVLVVGAGGSSAPVASPTLTGSPKPSKAPTVSDIFTQVGPSVAVVRTAKGALGTGVIASDNGLVVTAAHVVSDGTPITIVFSDGTSSAATVASSDAKTDIATLTPATLPQTVVPATIGGSVKVGGPVVAIGNPLGLTYSVSSGVVSGLQRTADTDHGKFSGLIQFDASANPGSSGGPLLDENGNVIGIVVSIAEPAGQDAFAGIAFAVPIGAALGGGAGASGGPGNGPQI